MPLYPTNDLFWPFSAIHEMLKTNRNCPSLITEELTATSGRGIA